MDSILAPPAPNSTLPGRTYERLRQICNAEYQVGQMNSSLPPDMCTDQKSGCCCNSIAFTLSMLCLNCQQAIGTGSGHDASPGTMENYWNASYDGTRKSHCFTPVYGNFSADIQIGVCNENIKIFDEMYPIAWPDGSWFYVYTRDTLHQDTVVEANNSFTICPAADLSNNSTNANNLAKSSSSSSSTWTHVNGIAIAGVVIGTVGILATLVTVSWILWRRWKSRKSGGNSGLVGTPFFLPAFEPQMHAGYLYGPGHNPPKKGAAAPGVPATQPLARHETLPPAYCVTYSLNDLAPCRIINRTLLLKTRTVTTCPRLSVLYIVSFIARVHIIGLVCIQNVDRLCR
ncbi:hypothetical protein C8R45DRAFT_593710 [Mycena sanguinolenta]|nr:hypothetical protein C8R45DRAFT_593710 [Mycena sanguinolenta]